MNHVNAFKRGGKWFITLFTKKDRCRFNKEFSNRNVGKPKIGQTLTFSRHQDHDVITPKVKVGSDVRKCT